MTSNSSSKVRLFLTKQNRIITLSVEDYMLGLGEEPDTEPYEKQRAFAIAARSYVTYYLDPAHRKFPGKDYDATDDPATFQKWSGTGFTVANPSWVKAVQSTAGQVLTKNNQVVRAPYFSTDDGQTRTPIDAGWGASFPFSEIFTSKPDPWCKGLSMAGHGVGMSGCGAKGQAQIGKTAEEILQYYYPGTTIGTR
jgi:SpoIID/LytB domain protein